MQMATDVWRLNQKKTQWRLNWDGYKMKIIIFFSGQGVGKSTAAGLFHEISDN